MSLTVPKEQVSAKRGQLRGQDPGTGAECCPRGRARCWAWALPRFRRAQGGLGLSFVVCPRARHPGVGAKGDSAAEVSSRTPGRAAGAWRGAGAAGGCSGCP